jgi:hypothetical protein
MHQGGALNASTVIVMSLAILTGGVSPPPCPQGVLCQPAYCIDENVREPFTPYRPQPGDIYLATDRSRIIQAGHRLALSGAPHHSGIVIALPDGRPAILEAGPFNGLRIEILEVAYDLGKHEERGEKVWIRQRRTPLTAEQSECLTQFALRQNQKPFAGGRMMLQMTPIRSRGPLRTFVLGQPHGDRFSYFCAELVMECCVAAGVLSPETTRPAATYPRDMFFDQSCNIFLNRYFTLADGWHPPARWFSEPCAVAPK